MSYDRLHNMQVIAEAKIKQPTIANNKAMANEKGCQDAKKGIYTLAGLSVNTMASYDAGYKEGFSKHVKH